MISDETRTRFFAAIATQIPADRVIELHLFGAIKQGGTESGVAVIAVEPHVVPSEAKAPPAATELAADRSADEASPYLPSDADDDGEPVLSSAPDAERPARRSVVYTARYRHTLKGPDRGKWEASVTEEADAPLVSVDAVVRGVSRRSGDADETVRLSGDEFRAALPTLAAAR